MGFSKAIAELKYIQHFYIKRIRDYLEKQLEKLNIKINCKKVTRLTNTTSATIDTNMTASEIVQKLSKKLIFVSTGSACNEYENKPSHVLKAIGLSDDASNKTIRISLNRYNTIYEINNFIIALKEIIKTTPTN